MGVGEANLQSRLTGDCDIDYGVGELNLTLIGTADDYRISLDKGAGKATLDGVKMSDDVVYGDGENVEMSKKHEGWPAPNRFFGFRA